VQVSKHPEHIAILFKHTHASFFFHFAIASPSSPIQNYFLSHFTASAQPLDPNIQLAVLRGLNFLRTRLDDDIDTFAGDYMVGAKVISDAFSANTEIKNLANKLLDETVTMYMKRKNGGRLSDVVTPSVVSILESCSKWQS
jgi:hypothetical protein